MRNFVCFIERMNRIKTSFYNFYASACSKLRRGKIPESLSILFCYFAPFLALLDRSKLNYAHGKGSGTLIGQYFVVLPQVHRIYAFNTAVNDEKITL